MNQQTTIQQQEGTPEMLPELKTLYHSIEKRKEEFLTCVEALPDEERRVSASPAEWSPLQVMDHVVLVEDWLAATCEAVPPAKNRVLMRGRLFIFFAGRIMRSRLRIPTLPMAVPQTDPDFTTIKQRWDNTREILARKLVTVTPQTRPLPISLHPVAGPLDATRVLILLDVHLIYHLRHFPRPR